MVGIALPQSRWSSELKHKESVAGAVVREYLAIAFQEMGLRAVARRLRAPRSHASLRIAHEVLPDPVAPDGAGAAHRVQLEGGASIGAPVIVDTESERHLQFSGDALQSRMRLDDPYALIAAYTRQMMSFLLFEPDPEHVLLIGLGGGSLAKFCYLHLPHARITVVEIDARVIALREAFSIPPDDHRFRIIHDDGARYLSRHEQPANAILIDAFDQAGVSPSLATSAFFCNVSRLLAPTGVLIMNLHGDPERFDEHLQQARKVFGSRTLLVQVTANDNVLLYAFAADAAWPAARQLFLRARHLQSKIALNFRHYLQRVREGWSL
jgi:spermidine synthase